VVALGFFYIFGVWEATIVAFVKLVHSSTCLCVFVFVGRQFDLFVVLHGGSFVV
jgi:hypothetical protein